VFKFPKNLEMEENVGGKEEIITEETPGPIYREEYLQRPHKIFEGKPFTYRKRKPGEKREKLFLGLKPKEEKFLRRRKFIQKPLGSTEKEEIYRKKANRLIAKRYNKEMKDQKNLEYYKTLSGEDAMTLEEVKERRKPLMNALTGLYDSPPLETPLGDFPVPAGLLFQEPYKEVYFDKGPYLARQKCVKDNLNEAWNNLPMIQQDIYGTKKKFKRMGPLKGICETMENQEYWQNRNYGKTRKGRKPGTKLTAHQIYFAKLMKSIGAAWRNLSKEDQKANYGSYTNFVSAVFSALQKQQGRPYGTKFNYNYEDKITIPQNYYDEGLWRQ